MIFSEQSLYMNSANAYRIINESEQIDGYSIISPKTISLVESNSVGGYVVRFNDVEALSEEYGIGYIDSMLAIAEANGIDPSYLAVAVNEADIILNPDLIYNLANVITVPQSPNSAAYQFCEACLEGYMYTGNAGYIDLLLEDLPYVDTKGKVHYDTATPDQIEAFAKAAQDRIVDIYHARGNSTANLDKATRKEVERLQKQINQLPSSLIADKRNEALFSGKKGAALGANLGKLHDELAAKNAGLQSQLSGVGAAHDRLAARNAELEGQLQGVGKAHDELARKMAEIENKGVIAHAREKGAAWISQKIAALNAKLTEYENQKASGKGGVWTSVKENALKLIRWILQRLHSILATKKAEGK